ncbi:3-keto-5-aminohexanoate cleavage protein [Frigidibacter sp. MR17.14]|uniref:3-keto-5-aminohexanoate cleavage protein n=1 Tax=Frigidibacter sp. MR17.14 TaxID=3126509 RepID=UPI0030131B13
MSRPVILTACINGGRPDAAALNPGLPVTPEAIAAAVAEAAGAGAAIAHLHARDPATGLPSNDGALWARVVAAIRDRLAAEGRQILLNLSASMDGLLLLDGEGTRILPGSTLKPPAGRAAHVLAARPEIGTLDCGTFALGEAVHVARLPDLRAMAGLYRAAGVLAEVECFDFGHLETARTLAAEGALGPRPFLQICLGTGYGGAPATPTALAAMRDRLPGDAAWAAFAAGPANRWVITETVAAGGHVRAGLEDTLLDETGAPQTNAALLAEAAALIARAGGRCATPAEARSALGL